MQPKKLLQVIALTTIVGGAASLTVGLTGGCQLLSGISSLNATGGADAVSSTANTGTSTGQSSGSQTSQASTTGTGAQICQPTSTGSGYCTTCGAEGPTPAQLPGNPPYCDDAPLNPCTLKDCSGAMLPQICNAGGDTVVDVAVKPMIVDCGGAGANTQCNGKTITCGEHMGSGSSGAGPMNGRVYSCTINCADNECNNTTVDCSDSIGNCIVKCGNNACNGLKLMCGANACQLQCDGAKPATHPVVTYDGPTPPCIKPVPMSCDAMVPP